MGHMGTWAICVAPSWLGELAGHPIIGGNRDHLEAGNPGKLSFQEDKN